MSINDITAPGYTLSDPYGTMPNTNLMLAKYFTSAGFLIFYLVFIVLSIIAWWKLFKKAGEAGWKSIIPIYNVIILFKIAGISPLWILGYLAGFIPIIGALLAIGITIYLFYSLAKAFGKGVGFTVGLIFLDIIFIMILAFGSSEYQLERK